MVVKVAHKSARLNIADIHDWSIDTTLINIYFSLTFYITRLYNFVYINESLLPEWLIITRIFLHIN